MLIVRRRACVRSEAIFNYGDPSRRLIAVSFVVRSDNVFRVLLFRDNGATLFLVPFRYLRHDVSQRRKEDIGRKVLIRVDLVIRRYQSQTFRVPRDVRAGGDRHRANEDRVLLYPNVSGIVFKCVSQAKRGVKQRVNSRALFRVQVFTDFHSMGHVVNHGVRVVHVINGHVVFQGVYVIFVFEEYRGLSFPRRLDFLSNFKQPYANVWVEDFLVRRIMEGRAGLRTYASARRGGLVTDEGVRRFFSRHAHLVIRNGRFFASIKSFGGEWARAHGVLCYDNHVFGYVLTRSEKAYVGVILLRAGIFFGIGCGLDGWFPGGEQLVCGVG